MELFQCFARKFATSTHQRVWDHGAGAEGSGSEGMRKDRPLPPSEAPKGLPYVDPVKEAQDQAERANAPAGVPYVDPEKRAEDIVVARNSGLLKILGANKSGRQSEDEAEAAQNDPDRDFFLRVNNDVGFNQLLAGGRNVDGNKVFKAILDAAGGKGTYERFVADWKKAKADGKLTDGKKIEDFERTWVADNCGRTDVFADVARVKAELGSDTRITVGVVKGPDLSRSLDPMGYAVARYLGFGNIPLSGQEIINLYDIKAHFSNPGSARNITFVFDPRYGTLSIEKPNHETANLFGVDFDKKEKQEYLAQLRKEKGIDQVVASR